VIVKIGRGVGRAAVKKALATRGPSTFMYTGILRAKEIRDAVAAIRDAGSPKRTLPLQAWLAGHPNAPEEVLRDFFAKGSREVLMSLALNPKLPSDLRKALLAHEDDEVRDHANHVFSKTRRH
jgi:hypothetical protein